MPSNLIPECIDKIQLLLHDVDAGTKLREKQEVLDRYQSKFLNPSALGVGEFLSFLRFKNNHHWTGLPRHDSALASDPEGLRRSLAVLGDESRSLEERFREATTLPHLGPAIATAILQVMYPEKYGVLNGTTIRGMKLLGCLPSSIRGEDTARFYVRLNDHLNQLAQALGVDLWLLDWVWWRARTPEPWYWAFCNHPQKYNVDQMLAERTWDTWTVHDQNVKAGDRVVLWRGSSGGKVKRAIVALGLVTSDPEVRMPAPGSERYIRDKSFLQPDRRVTVQWEFAPGVPLLHDEDPTWFEQFPFVRSRGGAVRRLLQEHWVIISQRLGHIPMDNDELVLEASAILNDKHTGRGQGYLPAIERLAIETYSMGIVSDWMEQHGLQPKDVSHFKSWDLEGRFRGKPLYVEVKGTKLPQDSVLLTAAELKHAEEHAEQTALIIVHDIKLHYKDSRPICSGGELSIRYPWRVREEHSEPLTFRCRLLTQSSGRSLLERA